MTFGRKQPCSAHHLQCLQNPKGPLWGPKMADGVWIGVYPKVFGHFRQLLLNKYLYPSTPSMRKGPNGRENRYETRTTTVE